MKTQRYAAAQRLRGCAEALLPCALPQTAGFSARGCACCFGCPTRRFGPSKSRPPPSWGETLRTRPTSPLTARAEVLVVRLAPRAGAALPLCSPYLAVEDVLGGPFLVLHVPDQSNTVRLVGSILVVVIRGHQELWILWRNKSGSGRMKKDG